MKGNKFPSLKEKGEKKEKKFHTDALLCLSGLKGRTTFFNLNFKNRIFAGREGRRKGGRWGATE